MATRQWWGAHVAAPADVLARRVPAFLADAEARDAQARGRLTAAARHQLRVHRERLGNKATALARTALGGCESRQTGLRGRAGRLGRALGTSTRAEQHADCAGCWTPTTWSANSSAATA